MNTSPTPRAACAGFTLIELMLAVAVASILLAVALPSYQASIRRAHRAEAHRALATVQQAQERHRASHSSYAGSLADLGLATASPTAPGHYVLALSAANATGYVATASVRPGSMQAADTACAQLSVTVAGGSAPAYESAPAGGSIDAADSNRCWGR